MRYQYKVVPFIGQSKGRLSAAEVASQLEFAISQYASQGWEFYQLSDVNIEVRPGCLAGLFGAEVQYARFDQLIFRSGQARATGVQDGARRAQSSEIQTLGDTRSAGDALREVSDESPTKRPPLPITSKHLDLWRQKSDEEVRKAAANLQDYTEEGRSVILAELARRSGNLAEGE